MDIKGQIVKYCADLGLDLIGFTPCREFSELRKFYNYRKDEGLENEFEEVDIEKRINPNHYMQEGKTIISIAFPYLHDGVYNSNTLPERYIAYLSGIGFIGKNNMLITKKYGSFVFLGEIITDLDIDTKDIKQLDNTPCKECNRCYTACPTNSINDKKKNCNICMSYITQKKEINDKYLYLMKGRIFGCDTCQNSCPCNKDIAYSGINEFKPLDFMNDNICTESILSLTNPKFKETFKTTSCGWRGKNILIRNSLIKMYLIENKNIEDYSFESPYLEEYKNRLLLLNKV